MGFGGFRVALNYVAQGCNAIVLTPQFDQRKAFFQFGCGSFVAVWKRLQDFVVVLHRLGIIAASILHFGKIEIGVPGQIGVGIKLYIVRKFLTK